MTKTHAVTLRLHEKVKYEDVSENRGRLSAKVMESKRSLSSASGNKVTGNYVLS